MKHDPFCTIAKHHEPQWDICTMCETIKRVRADERGNIIYILSKMNNEMSN